MYRAGSVMTCTASVVIQANSALCRPVKPLSGAVDQLRQLMRHLSGGNFAFDGGDEKAVGGERFALQAERFYIRLQGAD